MINQKNILLFLEKRGFLNQLSDSIRIYEYLKTEICSIYCGFDPTASSLHIGHLLPIILLKHFQRFGHNPFIILGGATSLIGDPSFKQQERDKLSYKIIIHNQFLLQKQLFQFFENQTTKTNNLIFLNNYSWFSRISFLSFLRDIGVHFSINNMIHKDSVKKRLFSGNSGISFTEFTYSLMQAYDFYYLYKKYKVKLQIGGSDQWGNIVSGIHLIQKLCKSQVFGLTLPLLTNINGEKFGKTENNTVWLDENKTSVYKFYQFWLNISDIHINNYLKLFTFLKDSELDTLINSENSTNNILKKKKILAEQITIFVHGIDKLNSAQRITDFFFKKISSIKDLKEQDFHTLLKDGIPYLSCNFSCFLYIILFKSNLATSLSQAKIMISSGAIKINNLVQKKINYYFQETDKIFGKYTLLSKGKKNYFLIFWK